MDNVELSIVIPVMNEEANIVMLADEIDAAMKKVSLSWNCVWVDDFSTDATRAKIIELCASRPAHKKVFHAANFGQSAALASGFRAGSSRYIATLDGDGQNDPASLPDLVAKMLETDADMVNGWREKRQDNWVRKLSSRIGNGFRNRLTHEKVRDVGCALRIFKREAIAHVPVFKGMHRYLPTLIRLGGFEKIYEVPVNHRNRERGTSKYGINNRLWVGIGDTMAVRWMLKRMVFPTSED